MLRLQIKYCSRSSNSWLKSQAGTGNDIHMKLLNYTKCDVNNWLLHKDGNRRIYLLILYWSIPSLRAHARALQLISSAHTPASVCNLRTAFWTNLFPVIGIAENTVESTFTREFTSARIQKN